MLGEISLEGLEFYSYHGFYEEERKVGNKFSIDVTITANFLEAMEKDSLEKTIDYQVLYEIVKKQVDIPSKLLETLGYNILNAIFEKFPFIEAAEVSISKFNPPMGGICKRALVKLKEHKTKK